MPARASALAIRTTVTHTAPFRPSAVGRRPRRSGGCRPRRPGFWAGRPERAPTSTAVCHPGRRHRRHAAGARPTTRTRSPAGRGSAAQRRGRRAGKRLRPRLERAQPRSARGGCPIPISPSTASPRPRGARGEPGLPPCRSRPARHTARHGRARASPMPAPASPTTASSYNPARASSHAGAGLLQGRAPTSTELRHMNVPFSHPSDLYPQKDGRKVRRRWEGTFTFRLVQTPLCLFVLPTPRLRQPLTARPHTTPSDHCPRTSRQPGRPTEWARPMRPAGK